MTRPLILRWLRPAPKLDLQSGNPGDGRQRTAVPPLILLPIVVALVFTHGMACTSRTVLRESGDRCVPSMPIPQSGVAIVVDKSARILSLYRNGRYDGSFSIVLGRQPVGRKRYEGDMRTPEGLYHISAKREHRRWQYFLALDYPAECDFLAYNRERDNGTIPEIDGDIVGIGAGLGIHGNDRPAEQRTGVDWTHGCIAMRADEMAQLYRVIDLGTPVLVVP